MSHSAVSIADSASVKMPPGPQASPVPARSLATMCSMRIGSSPTIAALRSSTAACSERVMRPP
jgi:hypothetical protein